MSRAQILATAIIEQYRDLCIAHNVDPPQLLTLRDWIYEALRMMHDNRVNSIVRNMDGTTETDYEKR